MQTDKILGIALLGVGAFLFANRNKANVPQFTVAELNSYSDNNGYLTLDQSFFPAVNSDVIGMFSSIGLGDVSYSFDWRNWAIQFTDVNPDITQPAIAYGIMDFGIQQIPTQISQQLADNALSGMTTSELIAAVADYLKGVEGFRPYVYDDVNGQPWTQSQKGNPTIGYGHMLKSGEPFDWTLDEPSAYNLLLTDVQTHLAPIISSVNIPLTLNQWITITSLAFNAGASAVKNSKFLQSVNAMDWGNAESNFKDWIYATVTVNGQKIKKVVQGLVNRRNQEWALFATPQDVVMLDNGSTTA